MVGPFGSFRKQERDGEAQSPVWPVGRAPAASSPAWRYRSARQAFARARAAPAPHCRRGTRCIRNEHRDHISCGGFLNDEAEYCVVVEADQRGAQVRLEFGAPEVGSNGLDDLVAGDLAEHDVLERRGDPPTKRRTREGTEQDQRHQQYGDSAISTAAMPNQRAPGSRCETGASSRISRLITLYSR